MDLLARIKSFRPVRRPAAPRGRSRSGRSFSACSAVLRGAERAERPLVNSENYTWIAAPLRRGTAEQRESERGLSYEINHFSMLFKQINANISLNILNMHESGKLLIYIKF